MALEGVLQHSKYVKNKSSPSLLVTPLQVFLPLGWGAHDDPVDQDSMCYVWEGGVSELQLSDYTGVKGKHNKSRSKIQVTTSFRSDHGEATLPTSGSPG